MTEEQARWEREARYRRMRRAAARGVLSLLVVATLVTMALVRTDLTMPVPFYGEKDVPILAVAVFSAVLLAVFIGVIFSILKLVEWAEF